MFRFLRFIGKSMGQGLLHQDVGEMLPTEEKLRLMQEKSSIYQLSGGQSRIVLLASNDPAGPAFDFVVEMARETNSLIEVLYVRPRKHAAGSLESTLGQLVDMKLDFQITFLSGDLLDKMRDYNSQRQDLIAVVCSRNEALAKELSTAANNGDQLGFSQLPYVLIVGGNILA